MPIIYPPAKNKLASQIDATQKSTVDNPNWTAPFELKSPVTVPHQMNPQGADTGEPATKGELDNIRAAISLIANELSVMPTARNITSEVNALLYPNGMKA